MGQGQIVNNYQLQNPIVKLATQVQGTNIGAITQQKTILITKTLNSMYVQTYDNIDHSYCLQDIQTLKQPHKKEQNKGKTYNVQDKKVQTEQETTSNSIENYFTVNDSMFNSKSINSSKVGSCSEYYDQQNKKYHSSYQQELLNVCKRPKDHKYLENQFSYEKRLKMLDNEEAQIKFLKMKHIKAVNKEIEKFDQVLKSVTNKTQQQVDQYTKIDQVIFLSSKKK